MNAFWCVSLRDVVRVSGPDATTYLQSQLSQDLRPVAPGQSVWSFVLQPTGKVDTLLRVWRMGDDEYVLDTDPGYGETMVARLNRFKIRVKAEIESLPWTSIAVRGVEALPGALVAWGSGYDLLGEAPEPPAGVAEGTPDDLLAARIEAGWPAMGAEIRPGETIPAETGVVDAAVSFTKGCYPGQELVERMDSRGASAPRHLVVLDAPDGAEAGSAVLVDGESVGTFTTVHGGRGLASVKRTAFADQA